jgi:hypothetical protein
MPGADNAEYQGKPLAGLHRTVWFSVNRQAWTQKRLNHPIACIRRKELIKSSEPGPIERPSSPPPRHQNAFSPHRQKAFSCRSPWPDCSSSATLSLSAGAPRRTGTDRPFERLHSQQGGQQTLAAGRSAKRPIRGLNAGDPRRPESVMPLAKAGASVTPATRPVTTERISVRVSSLARARSSHRANRNTRNPAPTGSRRMGGGVECRG